MPEARDNINLTGRASILYVVLEKEPVLRAGGEGVGMNNSFG